MRSLFALCLVVAPAFAEDPPASSEADGFSLMEEGMKLVLRGMMAEMEPALDEMDEALGKLEPSLKELGPKLMSLMTMIDDIGNYDAPVMLPNGDILIRRNVPLVPRDEPEPGPNGEIDL
ncbi:MAG TPA: AAA+ family ATPase [Tabrizicola sp.]|nr:AAA+ family ATPase [Tabrizicola sp.]